MSAETTLDQAWARLERTAREAATSRIVDLFAKEPERLALMRVAAAGLEIDLSKQSWTVEGLEAALDLVHAAGDRSRAGEDVRRGNHQRVRRAGPCCTRRCGRRVGADFKAQGEPVSREIEAGRAAMRALADKVRSEGRIKAIVHIGIGGSDLGPRLVWEALKPVAAADRAALRRQCRPGRGDGGLGGDSTRKPPWWWRCPRPSPPRRRWPT